MNRHVISVVGAAVVSVSALLVAAPPASAADESLSIKFGSADTRAASATWTDATDTLCVRAWFPTHATAFVRRPDGTWVRVRSEFEDDGRTCTPNLSIEEDYLTKFKLVWSDSSGPRKSKMKWIRT